MSIIIETVQMSLRDGVSLAADVYRPQTEARVPVLVQRTPYDKDASVSPAILRFVRAGYAVVLQDVRGRFASAGDFTPFAHEAADGADTVAWAAAQPWSTGRVGMIGGSYVGATQWLAATQAPPALAAIAPSLTASNLRDHWVFHGGALEQGFLRYWLFLSLLPNEIQRQIAQGNAESAMSVAAQDALDALPAWYQADAVPLLTRFAPYYQEWLNNAEDTSYWDALSPATNFAQITTPALNVGGWHDIFLKGTLANYQGMRARGGSPSARTHQHLIVGPWTHGVASGNFAERDYGTRANLDAFDVVGRQIRWYDHWLRNLDTLHDSPVNYFVMGANSWRTADAWPPPGTSLRPYYLHSDGHANTAAGNGWLASDVPAHEEADTFLDDPRHPVPTLGGQTLLSGHGVAARAGPWDHRQSETRSDVLCYTTPPMARALEVIGPVTVVLFVASSALDTDVVGRVLDVWPDGRAEIITDGIVRARYRDGLAHPHLLQPHQVYEIHLDLGATAHAFLPEHRLRLEVTGSNFPRFDVNPHTGAGYGLEQTPVPAITTIAHDAQHPSHLLIAVMEA
ncbi:MAG: CocE/NonD family hydrolase [Ktedonobacterales bacterium]|nr:CocE/NonD family hydrolase [Ktedonobacterales bacterium]